MRFVVGLYLFLAVALPAWGACESGFNGQSPNRPIALSRHWDHPYFLGFGEHLPSTPANLSINLPESMPEHGFYKLIEQPREFPSLTIQKKTEMAVSRAYHHLSRQYKDLYDVQLHQLGAGSTFAAFVVEPINDDFKHNPSAYSQLEQKKWRLSHGLMTLKALQIKSSENNLTTKLALKKTLFAIDAMNFLAKNITFDGQTLFDVAPIVETPESHLSGVFEQDYVYGPSAFDLQQALSSDKVYLDSRNYVSSKAFLALWDMTHEDAEALEPKMRALEVTFRKLDRWARTQPSLNELEGRANRLRDTRVMPIIFDLNFGKNIIYDVRRQKFVVIDA